MTALLLLLRVPPQQHPSTWQDFAHAIVAYFDTSFCACHKTVVLSTDPRGESTHWKQTVFYLDEVGSSIDYSARRTRARSLIPTPNVRCPAQPLVLGEGEEIRGTFSLRPSSESPRGVDIDLEVHVDTSRRGATRMSRTYKLR